MRSLLRPNLAGLAALLGLLAGLALADCGLPRWSPGGAPSVALFTGAELHPPLAPSPFTLQRAADGTAVSAESLRGRVALVLFGYTSCPDLCPVTLAKATQVYQQLGSQAGDVDTYFVTVDPERDTPQRLADYLGNFDPHITALTGSHAALEQALAAFGARAERRVSPDSPGGYTMGHSASLYLVDPQGRVRMVEPPDVTLSQLAADVRALLAAGPALAASEAWARAARLDAGDVSAAYLVSAHRQPRRHRRPPRRRPL